MIGGDPQQRVPSSVSGVSGLCTLGLCWVLSSVFRGSKESNKGGFPRAGPPVTAQNEEVGADSSKIEGTPPGVEHFGVFVWIPDAAYTGGVYHAF